MNLEELTFLKDLACQAALAAGKVIQSAERTTAVHKKDSGSSRASQVVTDIDLKAQQAIFEVIEPTLQKWDLAILSEERADDLSRLERDYFWAIDPLDGTLAYVEQSDGYAVSIALVSRQGEPQLGVVYSPVNDRLYEAIAGQGAFCNKERLEIPKIETGQFHFIIDRSTQTLLKKGSLKERLVQQLRAHGLTLVEHFSHSGAVENVCTSMELPSSCFLKVPKKEQGGGCIWDYGATACLYTEAGGQVSDIYGRRLELNSRDSVYMNERGVLYASSSELVQAVTSALAT